MLKYSQGYFNDVSLTSTHSDSNERLRIDPAALPSGDFVVFSESLFFASDPTRALPSPSEVRKAANIVYSDSRTRTTRHYTQPPAIFHSLKLLVKWGAYLTQAEGQCLWALPRVLPGQVPVPEIYGWSKDENELFIYMEYVQGITLYDRYDSLGKEEKETICDQLRGILKALRSLKQDPQDPFIGM